MQLGNYVVEVSELVHKPYAYEVLSPLMALAPLKNIYQSYDICVVRGQ